MIFHALYKNRISILREGVRLGWNLYFVRPSEDRRTLLVALVDQKLGGFCQNFGESWQNFDSENATAFAKNNMKKSANTICRDVKMLL